jgi:hypothetical protein
MQFYAGIVYALTLSTVGNGLQDNCDLPVSLLPWVLNSEELRWVVDAKPGWGHQCAQAAYKL